MKKVHEEVLSLDSVGNLYMIPKFRPYFNPDLLLMRVMILNAYHYIYLFNSTINPFEWEEKKKPVQRLFKERNVLNTTVSFYSL